MRNFLYIKKYTLILKRILRIRHFFHVCMRKSFLTFLHAHFIDILFLTSFLTYIFCFLHLYIVSYIFHIGVFYLGQKLAFAEQKPFAQIKGKKKSPSLVFFRGDSPEGSLSLPRSSLRGSLSHKYNYNRE